MRSRIVFALTMAVVLLLASCTSIPFDGAVSYHTPEVTQEAISVRVAPLPPVSDASPDMIVDGFLHAMSVYQPDYAVARQYLTPEASVNWDPAAGVTIYSDGYPKTTADKVVLAATLSGMLDPDGNYHSASGQVKQDFGLVLNALGQWRISKPPAGLLISKYLFQSGYLNVDMNYMNYSGDALVPESVWISGGEDHLLRGIRRLLSGPGEWLRDLVKPMPAIDVISVNTNSEVVEIELSLAANYLVPSQRRELLAELVSLVGQFRRIATMRVSVAGTLWRADSDSSFEYGPKDFPEWIKPASNGGWYGIRDEGVVRITSGSTSPDVTPILPDLTTLNDIAVSQTRQEIAVVAKDRTQLLTTSLSGYVQPALRHTGKEILRPGYAPSGELWFGQKEVFNRLHVVDADQVIDVPATLPEGISGELAAFMLSEEGERVAIVLHSENTDILGIMRIVRQPELVLTGWESIDLATTSVNIFDVGWSAPTQLSVGTQVKDKRATVTQVSTDSAILTDVGPVDVPGMYRIVSTVAGEIVVLSSDSGTAFRFEADSGWSFWLNGLAALAVST